MRCLWLFNVVLLAAASSAEEKLPWWKVTNFYQVYPRSFKDSDGDGVGDLKGVIQKASYFKDIGVDAIWLSPILESPMVDFGYDISNYTAIDQTFGTTDDFKQLAKTLKDLDVKFLMDLVPNHSSDKHPWFVKSVAREEPYTDFFVWVDGNIDPVTKNHTPPNNWLSVFSGSAWEWHPDRQQYYYHAFTKQQPDLNFRSAKLQEAMEDVIKYWLDIGIDGFRVDSVNYLVETADIAQNETLLPGASSTEWKDYYHNLTQNQDENYVLLEKWAQIFYNYTVTTGQPRAMFLEAYTDLGHTMRYYGHGNTSLMQPFNFELLVHGNMSTRAPNFKQLIDLWMQNMPEGDVPNWVVGNHDNGRIADKYGHTMVDVIHLMTGILPGIKVTYYGNEMGMHDTYIRWDETVDTEGIILGPYRYQEATRDPERTPMQWDDSVSAGFSTNSTPWLPVNPNYFWLNVDAQWKAENSHLKVFKSMSDARKDPVLQRGNLTVFTTDNDTLAIVRSYNNESFVLLINMGSTLRVYNSQNFFTPQYLDQDWKVITGSINYNGPKIGSLIRSKSLNIQMRPKSAVLLRTPTASAAGQHPLSWLSVLTALLSLAWR